MFLTKLKAENYRNYSHLDIRFPLEKKYNFLVSPNGMGKSNLLEMIYYLSHVRSFRGALDKEIIHKGAHSFFISAEFEKNQFTNLIRIQYEKHKDIFWNDKKIKKHSDVLGQLLTVLFSNDDLFIISGNPALRRRYFDIFFSILDREYLFYFRRYLILLKQKNQLLKSKNEKLLFTFDIQLAESMIYLQQKRIAMIEKINSLLQPVYEEIGHYSLKVKLIYKPSLALKEITQEEIIARLEQNKKYDLEKGYMTLGSHRDQYLFLINGIYFSKYASFGQTRLAALVLKLIQAMLYEKQFKQKPILLVDDVILELDPQRQKNFLSHISKQNQIFFTVTDKKYADFIAQSDEINIMRVEHGQIIST